MNRRLIILVCILSTIILPTATHAQKGLNIEAAFSPDYTMLPEATETMLTRRKLHGVSLSLYRALSITGNAEVAIAVERMVLADGRSAVTKEVRYASGHLLYGLYVLPRSQGQNRYILFLNGNLNSSGKMLLLYLEGKASMEDVKKMINKGK